ncbi:hypothetical protein M8C21_006810, partial [Ambrosia artemisiifolia]
LSTVQAGAPPPSLNLCSTPVAHPRTAATNSMSNVVQLVFFERELAEKAMKKKPKSRPWCMVTMLMIGVLKRRERGSTDNGTVVVATFPAAAWINNEGLEIWRRQSCSTKHVALETSEELDLHTRAFACCRVDMKLCSLPATMVDGTLLNFEPSTHYPLGNATGVLGFIGVQLRSTISRKYGVCNFLNRVNTGVLCSLLGHGNDGNGSVPSQGTIVLVQGAGGISAAAAAASLITTPLDTINTQLQVMGHDKRPNTRQLIKTLITEDWLGSQSKSLANDVIPSIQGFSPINSKMFHGGTAIEAKMLNAIL